ncbi:hypothetical protein RJ641_006466 [Dillenia turbinata]|uniref:Uncharacterized protein n=1 Tax=Dillenia turbinata TaxID=194707 RepID=A0AAN8V5J6_9MAGN
MDCLLSHTPHILVLQPLQPSLATCDCECDDQKTEIPLGRFIEEGFRGIYVQGLDDGTENEQNSGN